ncbi:MAG: hypothetical protein VR69_12975 [Peptococcaceae bacterium BRH_c4b]|nr:MAG: hypothetical protein VR69_12975 [Peptococcaceae bacterium BRH_c4b]
MNEVVIVSAVRTPFGKFGGILKDFSTVDLGSMVVKEVIKRASVSPEAVEEVYMGANMPCSNRSIARQITLKAGLPDYVNSATMDRACCSSSVAIATAYRAIKAGEVEIAIGGGTENLSQVPYFLDDLRWGKRIGEVVLKDIVVVTCPYTGVPRAVQAGKEAVEHGLTREDQDRWALRSQKLYGQALAAQKFNDEIMPVEIPSKKGAPVMMSQDEGARPDTTLEALAGLSTVYGSPTVTAGNAPGLNTGASALLLMSRQKADELGISPLATIIAHAQGSGHPQRIASIPAYTAQKALKKAGMNIGQMDLVEINEAFAAMPLVSTKILGKNDPAKIEKIRDKTNVNGGAIAIGHPTGASAGRLLMTLIYELRRRGGKYGLMAICGGIGEGESFIVKI